MKLYTGDMLTILPKKVDDDSIDSIVTDPPYGLNFMGEEWDRGVPGIAFWKELLRVAKPGAFLLAFGGTRTFHRLTCAIEDAGWEIRDCIMWVYGSGFPKSLDISKALDKMAGVERTIVGSKIGQPGYSLKHQGAGGVLSGRAGGSLDNSEGECAITAPATDVARQWEGWGTALKPAWEPIIVARKPVEGSVAQNVLKYSTGGININGCRIKSDDCITNHSRGEESSKSKGKYGDSKEQDTHQTLGQQLGRFPANLIHDGSDEVVSLFPQTSSSRIGNPNQPTHGINHSPTSFFKGDGTESFDFKDSGSAARFFYTAKASRSEREKGCQWLESEEAVAYSKYRKNYDTTDSFVSKCPDGTDRPMNKSKNDHPTVKPVSLMKYLCRLVTPPKGVVLDPFMGSGTTGKAAIMQGFDFIGIDIDQHYVDIAKKRIHVDAPIYIRFAEKKEPILKRRKRK